jgi:hypothetical protein
MFGMVFGPLFGGILAYRNLSRLGRPAKGWQLLWGCTTLTATLLLVGNLPGMRGMGMGLFVFTGLWLGNWHEQLAPEARQHPRQPVGKPLLISLLVMVGLLVV